MLTRRRLLGLVAAAPALGVLRRAEASPAVGRVYGGRPEWDDARRIRARTVPLVGGGRAVLGASVRVRDAHVYSIANANDRYAAWLDIGRQRRSRELFLILPDGTAVYASSSWSADAAAEIWFEMSAIHAAILADGWGVAVMDRAPLDRDLVATWRPAATPIDLHGPIGIDLVIENRGATTIVVGTSPLLRDNFTFTATENGVALPPIPPGMTIGPVGFIPIAPGATVTITGDLAKDVRIERGGVYAVTCELRAFLVLDPTTGGSPDHAHERWDFAVTGAVEVRVE